MMIERPGYYTPAKGVSQPFRAAAFRFRSVIWTRHIAERAMEHLPALRRAGPEAFRRMEVVEQVRQAADGSRRRLAGLGAGPATAATAATSRPVGRNDGTLAQLDCGREPDVLGWRLARVLAIRHAPSRFGCVSSSSCAETLGLTPRRHL